MRLQGKKALVTGGARGIGYAIARAFAYSGADIAIADRDSADGAAAQIRKQGYRCTPIQVDVTMKKSVDSMFNLCIDKIGVPDIVVSSAGVCRPKPFLELEESDWDEHMNVNLKGAFLVGQKGAKEMVKAGIDGAIINVSSVNGMAAESMQAHYNASKGGMNLLTMSMALELAEKGIRVNALCPGFIQTRLTQPAINDPSLLSNMLHSIPMGRVGEPAEVADAAVFLASKASRYITGHCLVVDGGQFIKLS